MNVAELIERLKNLDQDLKVCYDDGGVLYEVDEARVDTPRPHWWADPDHSSVVVLLC